MIQKQSKSKWYILIICILFIANIILLFFFFDKKENHQNRSAIVKDFLQKQVGFSNQQLLKYDSLSKRFRENTKMLGDSLKLSKDEEFTQLCTAAFKDSVIVEITNKLASNQKIMELQLINHVATVRKLCTQEQQQKFDSLFYKIWQKKKR